MQRRKYLVPLLMGAFILMVFAGSTALMAQKPYEGVSLTVMGSPWWTGWIGEVGKEWATKTGAKVDVVAAPEGQQYEKLMSELIAQTGAYDIVITPSFWAGDLAGRGYIVSLDDLIEEGDPLLALDDVLSVFRDRLNKWAGKTYLIQLDGDVHAVYYRKDLFENPEEKANFYAEYGYELQPPETWEQWLEIGKFFARRKGEMLAGEILERDFFGAADLSARGRNFWWFLNRWVNYVKEPHFFDPDTMDPLINTPGAVVALENLIASNRPYVIAPPGILTFNFFELLDAFTRGDIAMCVQWPDVGPHSADPEKSEVLGKVGFALMPGMKRVYDVERGEWVELPQIQHRAMLAHGWAASIIKTSPNPKAAFDFIRYLTSPPVSLKYAMIPETGSDPYRYSHFKSEEFRNLFPGGDEYLENLLANIEVGYADLRIPGAASYMDLLDYNIHRALAGEISAQQALDETAKNWRKMTYKLGLEAQLKLYRESYGLPPLE